MFLICHPKHALRGLKIAPVLPLVTANISAGDYAAIFICLKIIKL